MLGDGAPRAASVPVKYTGEVKDFDLKKKPASVSNTPQARIVGFGCEQQQSLATLTSSAPTPLVCQGVKQEDDDDAKELEEWFKSTMEIQKKYPVSNMQQSLRHNASSDSRADSKFKQLSSTRHPVSDAGKISLINTPEVIGRTRAQKAQSQDIW